MDYFASSGGGKSGVKAWQIPYNNLSCQGRPLSFVHLFLLSPQVEKSIWIADSMESIGLSVNPLIWIANPLAGYLSAPSIWMADLIESTGFVVDSVAAAGGCGGLEDFHRP